MSIYLAYTGSSRPTGRALAQELRLPHYGIRPPRNGPPEILIRWGSRVPMGDVVLKVLNNAVSIGVASDKVRTLEILDDNGIPHVPFFTDWEQAQAYGGVVLGRRRRGMQGRDIVVYEKGEMPAPDHEWYSIYQKPTREMRLHVVGDEVVRIQGKYLDFPEHTRNPYVRNYANGYRFRSPSLDLRESRRQWAVEAVKVLGLDFGAVDMLLFGDEEECSILEINTAPACSPLTVSAYARAIERKINEFRGGESPRS